MPFTFNKKLWDIGRQVEDEIKPHLEKFLECNFERRDDVFDVLDFHSPKDKKIVEVKGRSTPSDRYPTTIITCGKLTEGLMEMERGYDVWYFFVFTDKTMYFKLDLENCDFDIRRTGTNKVPHYLIPIDRLTNFEPESEDKTEGK